MGATPVALDLPEPLDVFDGTRLHTFPAGRGDVPADQVVYVLNGADHLPEAARRAIDAQVAGALAAALVNTANVGSVGLETNLSSEALRAWLGSLGSAEASQTATPSP